MLRRIHRDTYSALLAVGVFVAGIWWLLSTLNPLR
jgi:hypothetical protein